MSLSAGNTPVWQAKESRLLVVLGAFFVGNALLAEFIGVKIFSVERTLGFEPVNWTLFGVSGLSLNMTAGVLIWPLVFVMTDIINEYYGQRGVKLLSYMAAGIIAYAYLVIQLAVWVVPADFWQVKNLPQGQVPLNAAFQAIFGQGAWIIIGSLVAFLIGQLVDAVTFHLLKHRTGERMIWLRATGSTVISQLIDSFVVIFIAFYLGAGWQLSTVLAIAAVNYIYKVGAAIVLTPLVYLGHWMIDRYLGPKKSAALRAAAHQQSYASDIRWTHLSD